MDMPNEHIMDAFLQLPVRLIEGHPRGVEQPELDQLMAITREQRSNVNQIGAGDGLHNNNQLDFDENLPQFVIFRGRPNSKIWQYMPLLVLISSLVFKSVLSLIGLDTQNTSLFGLSLSTHFNLLQWIVLFGTYYFKGFN